MYTDIRLAVRSLRREPALVVGVIASFALAVGANAAMLGLVRQLMLAPPPGVSGAERVARVTLRVTPRDGEPYAASTSSYPAFRALAGIGAFEAAAAVRSVTLTFGSGAATTAVAAVEATGNYFAVLGARPAVGRFFGKGDDVPPAGNPVVVLGHAFWRRALGGDPAGLGREVVVDGRPFTVVGVAARGFRGDGAGQVDLFVPLSAALRDRPAEWVSEAGMNLASVVVRRRAGVAPAAAAQMASAALGEVTAARADRRADVALDPLVPGLGAARGSPQARVGFDPAQEPAPVAPATLPCREVVGVVADSRARSLRPDGREATLMQYYVPFEQLPAAAPFGGETPDVFGILVGTAGDPARAAGAVQRALQGASPRPAYARVRPYAELLDPQLRPWRLGATLFSALGMLAVAIAAVGLFGVVSYLVARRTREIGVRLALGGTRSRAGGAVVVDAVRMVAWGVAGGLAAAVALAPLVQSMLFQTSARDVVVRASAGAARVLVTAAASAVPAWRAARVSPLVALRAE